MALAFSCYMLVNMVYGGLKMAACTRCACCLPVCVRPAQGMAVSGMQGSCFGLQAVRAAPLPTLPNTSRDAPAFLLVWLPGPDVQPPPPLPCSVGNGLGAGSASAAKLSARTAVYTVLPIWAAQSAVLLVPQAQLAVISLFTSGTTDPGEAPDSCWREGLVVPGGSLRGNSQVCAGPARCWAAALTRPVACTCLQPCAELVVHMRHLLRLLALLLLFDLCKAGGWGQRGGGS